MLKQLRLPAVLLLGGAAFAAIPATAGATDRETWIVTYDAPPTAEQAETLAGIASGVHAYQHLPAAVAVVAPGAAGLLANLPGVRGVYPNHPMEWLLDESTRAIRADGVWADGYTGAGIGVAVVDAGVDGSHPDLCAAIEFCNGTEVKTVQNVKIIGDQEKADPVVVVENQISTDSSSGHGSHVAGIAAGFGSASETPGRYRGVAHGAKLIGLGTGEVAAVTTVLAAFDWILANHANPAYNIKVVNNSWGPGAGAQYDPNEPVQRGIAAMHDAGIAVVFGAGNDGPRTGTINVFGANPKAISAAASTKSDHIALFSSRGVPGHSLLRPTVTTPGMFIASVRARTGFYAWAADALGPDFNDPILPPDDVSYAYASGTSMASPHVAGVVALMQQAAIANLGRYLTPAEVKHVLQNTAVSNEGGAPGLPNYQGYTMGAGLVDALAAVRAIAAGTSPQPYDDTVVEDARTFKGTIVGSASSFETTYAVAPGAVSLDVMIDWSVVAEDLDIDLYRPDGVRVYSTSVCLGVFDFLRAYCLAGEEGPNQYSSVVTGQPNERINVNFPVAGTWRAVVKGAVSASETVYGVWAGVYPDGTALPAAQAPATVSVAGPAAGVAGRTVSLTATITDAAGFPVSNATVNWSSAGVGHIVTAETLTDERGTALATADAASLGTQVVTATAGTVSGSTAVLWVGLPTLPAAPPSTPGRINGGGHIASPAKKHFAFFAEYTAQSSAVGGEMRFDDRNGTVVQATALGTLGISGNQGSLTGDASVNGSSGYQFTLTVTDNGDPGGSDHFSLVVTQPLNPLYRYETAGALSGGNIKVQGY